MKLENICPNTYITARLTHFLKIHCKKTVGALGLIFFKLKKEARSAVDNFFVLITISL